jgi:hypothetical protein
MASYQSVKLKEVYGCIIMYDFCVVREILSLVASSAFNATTEQ